MREIHSYQVHLSDQLTTKKILDLNQFVKKSNHDIYLYQDAHIADAGNCPKLLSFFLVADIRQPIVIVIDGDNPENIYEQIRQLIGKNVKSFEIRNSLKGTSSVSFVI